MKNRIKNKFFRFLKFIYVKLFRINDSAQKIALGLGLGVFLGIVPGTGPIASLFVASVLKINRASAILGSLLTNTWLSIVTFLLAVKLGSRLMGIPWQEARQEWVIFLKDFHVANLFKLSILKIIFPVILGYFLIAFALGLVVYLIAVVVITWIRHENKNRAHFPH